MSSTPLIPKTQRAALHREQRPGAPVDIMSDYPVPQIQEDEVLAKVLYCGVCQSGRCPLSVAHYGISPYKTLSPDLHTKNGTAAGADGKNIIVPHLPGTFGHEAIARIVAIGPLVPRSQYRHWDPRRCAIRLARV